MFYLPTVLSLSLMWFTSLEIHAPPVEGLMQVYTGGGVIFKWIWMLNTSFWNSHSHCAILKFLTVLQMSCGNVQGPILLEIVTPLMKSLCKSFYRGSGFVMHYPNVLMHYPKVCNLFYTMLLICYLFLCCVKRTSFKSNAGFRVACFSPLTALSDHASLALSQVE